MNGHGHWVEDDVELASRPSNIKTNKNNVLNLLATDQSPMFDDSTVETWKDHSPMFDDSTVETWNTPKDSCKQEFRYSLDDEDEPLSPVGFPSDDYQESMSYHESMSLRQASVQMPQHYMTAMSIVAVYQSHDEEGLNTDQVERKYDLFGPNLMISNPTCCPCFPCVCRPIRCSCLDPPSCLPMPVTCPVMRDGALCTISPDQLVPGDLIQLTPGLLVPADVRMIGEGQLQVDYQRLVGEAKSRPSTPKLSSRRNSIRAATVPRDSSADVTHQDILEATNMLLCGSTVVSGSSLGIVTSTGMSTYFARTLLPQHEARQTYCAIS